MENKALGKVSQENAEEICARIRHDAQTEVQIALERAQNEAQRILASAQDQAEQKKQAVLKGLDTEIQKLKDKILSTLNLEKKRLILAEKDKFVQSVFETVKAEATRLRETGGYPGFLEKAILEGAAVIGDSHIEVHYSALDEQIMSEGFIKRTENGASLALKKQCALKFHKDDFSDPGVIVYSADGRTMFDNRFSARLERIREEISMELLKEAL